MNSSKVLWGLVVLNLLVTSLLAVVIIRGDTTKHFIENNAEVVLESVNSFLAEQQNQGAEDAQGKIAENEDFLYGQGNHPFVGNRNADFTIIEFLDYNCGFCKRAHVAVKELIEKNDDLKVVMVQFPILSPSSNQAAAWALAADDQGKFEPFHNALLEGNGPINEDRLKEIATSIGLDADQLAEAANGNEILARLEENKVRAFQMGFQGTPGFIIGDEAIRGFMEYPAMQATLDAQRNR